MNRGWVTSIDQFDRLQVQGTELVFYPAAAYCYSVGKNSIEEKQSSTPFFS